MKKPISFSNFSEADTHKTQDIEAKEAVSKDGKKLVIVRTGNPRGIPPKTEGGLWDNIHKRRKAGKAPKKPGDKGYPKTLDIESKEVNEMLPAIAGMAVRKMATKKIGKIGGRVAGALATKAAMSKEKDEGYVSNAQRAAVWANRADGGKGHPDNKKKSKKNEAFSSRAIVKKDRQGDGKPMGGYDKVAKKYGVKTIKLKDRQVKLKNFRLPKEEVSELKKSTLGSYVKKATDELEKGKVKNVNKIGNRAVGIDTATDKMRGEAFSSRAIV